MRNDEAPTSSRVTAAKALLDLSLKSLETEDLDVRIQAIEEQVQRFYKYN